MTSNLLLQDRKGEFHFELSGEECNQTTLLVRSCGAFYSRLQ